MLVEVIHLKKYFPVRRTFFDLFSPKYVHAVDDVSFDIKMGEFFGLVGESGCGKTTTGLILAGLIKPTSGKIIFDGNDITFLKLKNEMRRKIQMVFQNPFSSLNPRMRVKDLITEGMIIHKLVPKDKVNDALAKILDDVGLGMEFAERYPDELSGGQRQRVCIARSVALNPEFLIADEPTASLDVSVRAQILELFDKIRKKFNMSILFITHDIHTVKTYADRVAVMYLGKIVEIGKKEEIFSKPSHPYTKILLDSVPDFDKIIDEGRYRLKGIEGEIPSPLNPPYGCRFRTRCPYADSLCEKQEPEINKISDTHFSACHYSEKIKDLKINL